MKVFGDRGLEVLFPKCEYVNDIKEAQVIYFKTFNQYMYSLSGRDKYKCDEYINVELEKILSQANPSQLLILCGGFCSAYASKHGFDVGVTGRQNVECYPIVMDKTAYHVVGGQASIINPKTQNKSSRVIAKSYQRYMSYIYGINDESVNYILHNGEAEIIYFRNTNEPNCLCLQFIPDFYEKFPIIPKLISRIKKYIA